MEVHMKKNLHWSIASALVFAVTMLMTAPAAFACGPRAKRTASTAAATQAVTASRKQTMGGYIDNLLGVPLFPQPRSYKASAAIVGGSAATGAVVGGLLKGKKGAIIGAIVGGTAGFIYDHKTANR
jgi:hypothetical protein